MKRNWKELLLRIVILLVGLTIAHLGVALFYLTFLGTDPFNVLVDGVFRTISSNFPALTWFSTGWTWFFLCLLIVLILLIVDRTYIKIGTVVCMAFGGFILDFFKGLLGDVITDSLPYAVRLSLLAAGCIILAYGMTIVIKSDAGTGPNDLVSIAISDKAHFRFGITRVVTDFLFVLIGFLLGGKVGEGTVVCAFLVGFVAEWFLPLNGKIVDKILSKS